MASTDNVPPAPDAVGSNSEATPENTAATNPTPQSVDETGNESTLPAGSNTATTNNNNNNNTPSAETETDTTPTPTAQATESAGDATATATPEPEPAPAPAPAPNTTPAETKAGDESEVVAVVTEGETSDQSQAAAAKEDDTAVGPELVITLLLTTGARHPFKIDEKYLRGRSVNVENDDPFNMSVYTLKELIWREWRSGRAVRKSNVFSALICVVRMGTPAIIPQLHPTYFIWKAPRRQVTTIR